MDNNSKAREYINSFFNLESTLSHEDEILKDGLIQKINDLIWIEMEKGVSYEEAFSKAKLELGDINKLISKKTSLEESFPNSNTKTVSGEKTDKQNKVFFDIPSNPSLIPLVALAYVFIGLVTRSSSWWAVAWVMIPITAILTSVKNPTAKLISLMPFIYVILGFTFGLWSIAWVIIPVAAILGSVKNPGAKLISLTPFIYVILGLTLGLWSTAWIIIPVVAILAGSKKF